MEILTVFIMVILIFISIYIFIKGLTNESIYPNSNENINDIIDEFTDI